MAIIKKTITSVGEDGEKLESSYIARRTLKWCSSFGKEFSNSLKTTGPGHNSNHVSTYVSVT